MRRKLTFGLTLIVITILLANTIFAQPRSRRFRRPRQKVKQTSAVGIQVGNDFENDQLLIGGQFWLPLGIFWKFVPSAEYFFTDNDSTRWQFNGDFLFKPKPNGMLHFGGGIAMQYLNSDVINEQMDFGWNLIVGLDFGRLRGPVIYPFVQARWTFIEKEEYFSVLGGINLILR